MFFNANNQTGKENNRGLKGHIGHPAADKKTTTEEKSRIFCIQIGYKKMDTEGLKIIKDERQTILNGILDELQTQSLRDLFYDTRAKENRIETVKNILEEEYEILYMNEFFVKKYKGKECWVTSVSETLARIEAIENDYSNYTQGGYGYISGYLDVLDESESEEEEDVD